MDRKKKLRAYQILLLFLGFLIIFFTYIKKNKFSDEQIITSEAQKKIERELAEQTSDGDVFFNIEYSGLDLAGNRYILKSKEAKNNKNNQEIVLMTKVEAIFHFKDGTVLNEPLIEYCLKDDALGDPLIADEHIYAFDWATKKEIDKIRKMILRINDFMIGMFRGIGIKLIDFKLEFGRIKINGKNEVILADEISPDTCRLWDSLTDKKLDKDRFRKDLGDLIPAYTEVAKRLGILHEQSNVSAVNVTKLSSIKKKNK